MLTSYDEVPYPSDPFPQTHPDHLATIATLFGLSPPPVETCRVLELGCASGGNLVPLAAVLPRARFVGVDLSARQIASGRGRIAQLELSNVRLDVRNITDVGADFGEFDYVICHGVYSWVPATVQDAILAVCQRHLAANGVAFVSYNTLPGWRLRGVIRDLMIYHGGTFPSPAERVQQARAMLEFIATATRGEATPYSLLLRQESEFLARSSDSYLFHEHLEDCNEPLYFHQFAARLPAKGLRYLGDADFSTMLPLKYEGPVRQTLREIAPDQLQMEQYLDFLRNRMFRQSLVCRREQRPDYAVGAEAVARLHVASKVRPAADSGERPVSFTTAGGLTVTSKELIVQAAFTVLGKIWPRSLPFAELQAAAREGLGGPADPAEDVQQLGDALLTAYSTAPGHLVDLRTWDPPLTAQPGDCPVASELARAQALEGPVVTNLRHGRTLLNEFGRQVLPLLDGAHSRAAIVEEMLARWHGGRIDLRRGEAPVTDDEQARAVLTMMLDEQLARLARMALLQN